MGPWNTTTLSFGQLNTNFTDLNICSILFKIYMQIPMDISNRCCKFGRNLMDNLQMPNI